MKVARLRILFVSSEAHPLIKTGGLADVSGSLPAALRDQGEDVRLLIPGYPSVMKKLQDQAKALELQDLPYVGRASLVQGKMPDTGVEVLAIDCPSLYQRAGNPYLDTTGRDWEDNPVRFGVLSMIAARLGCSDSPLQDWIPDIVQCNDWQTGLTPAYMQFHTRARPSVSRARCVFGIHNLAFQGCFAEEWVARLGLPPDSYQMQGLEYYGQMSFLKAGVFYADGLVTVSPTYAREIQTAEFGFGMQGLLAERGHEIRGILNGIDVDEWNPATDLHLAHVYDENTLTTKQAVKLALQQQQGLQPAAQRPLLGVVSRLTHQKGLDMLLPIADALITEQQCQLVLLGGGEAALEQGFRALAQRHPGSVSVSIGYNEALSHQIMAGADIFVMPSRFEPCGLNQMYGMRYGTPPVVNRTGGLADSIIDTTPASLQAQTATGFIMESADTTELYNTLRRAINYFHDQINWKKIQQNGMHRDLGWEQSAKEYIDVYQSIA
ncbi:glycogen synthase GlgA [Methylovorus mays]|uniref:glycogen synthase GlgA n=1 Tax=Methylovorus mays TaxID=184077 RepID=UPI001E31B277|nr:glycogen synthase GlgA [Methylovorus mays]MCB5206257.1 glycogen synthase GlgA [Methylovorus mays]